MVSGNHPFLRKILTTYEMSSTESGDDHALADSGPQGDTTALGFSHHSLQQTLATYRYENALIKTELAATLERHAREMEELKLKYQSQMKEIEQQRLYSERQIQEIEDRYTDQERKMQQANLNLQQRIKATEEDLEEANRMREKGKRERSEAEEEHHSQVTALQNTLQSLKNENNQLRETLDRLQGSLDKEKTTSRELCTTLNAEKHQQHLIKSRLTEVEQQCHVKLTAAQAEAAQVRKAKEQESASAAKRIEELMSTLEEERAALLRVKERAAAKEAELERRILDQRQSQLTNSHQLVQQNSQLLERIKSLEATISSLEGKSDGRVHELEQTVQNTVERLHKEEREKAVLNARVATLESLESLLKREKEENSSLREELHRQEAEGQRMGNLNKDMQRQIQDLKTRVAEVQSQEESLRTKMDKDTVKWDQQLSDQRISHQEELDHLRARITTLQTQLNDKNKSYLEECSHLKQKVRTYGKLIKKLRYKLEVEEVQMERLEAQRAALQDNVPSHVHRRLQHQLQDMTRKHNEFAAFIRGLSEFQSALPQLNELTSCMGAVGQKLSELEEDQLHCLSELESL
ncbi:paramyosin-like [Penaeus chinensis]|uniref:paramyosin-like n=1 Tax=Penaeus chinensis TaxID=139456 RepID=UPI001FB6CE28|nr:paramyosin-like [Penaeus chinensis]